MYKVIGWTSNTDSNFPATEIFSQEMIDAIVTDIRAHRYEFTGEDHRYHAACTPVLNNGKRVVQKWGGIMAYAHNVDNWDEDAYLYYFFTPLANPKYPSAYVDMSAIVTDFVETEIKEEHVSNSTDLKEFHRKTSQGCCRIYPCSAVRDYRMSPPQKQTFGDLR